MGKRRSDCSFAPQDRPIRGDPHRSRHAHTGTCPLSLRTRDGHETLHARRAQPCSGRADPAPYPRGHEDGGGEGKAATCVASKSPATYDADRAEILIRRLIFRALNNDKEYAKQRLMPVARQFVLKVVIGKTLGHQPATLQIHDSSPASWRPWRLWT